MIIEQGGEAESMKKLICENCGKELSVSQSNGLCGYCKRTMFKGMAHGYSEEAALAVAKEFATAGGINGGIRIIVP